MPETVHRDTTLVKEPGPISDLPSRMNSLTEHTLGIANIPKSASKPPAQDNLLIPRPLPSVGQFLPQPLRQRLVMHVSHHFDSNLNLTPSAPKLTSKDGEVRPRIAGVELLEYHWFPRMAKFDRPVVVPVAAKLWHQWQGCVTPNLPFFTNALGGCGEGVSLRRV
ncbi:hypothetical protein N431DRAFT_75893 [Stipitochalara longipes BDJ]|nr:hypothetical protein N431DRAFT_75893 [Stipitochalara longipes BDJ]